MTNSWYSWLLLIGTAFADQGCVWNEDFDDDEVVVVPPDLSGFLTVEWSIAGGLSPSDCAAFGAEFFELVIYDEFGSFATEFNAPCEAFALSIELPEGVFDADATLVDGADFAVTLTERLEDLLIVDSTELVVSIDFPPGSFLTSKGASAQ